MEGRSGVVRGLRYGGCVSAVGWHRNPFGDAMVVQFYIVILGGG